MGGGPMGGGPMGAGPTTGIRPIRRGTSKAVPIVVSAGLAVGVFCGLLFGVGKKSEAVAAAPSKGTNVKPPAEEPKPDKGAAPAGLGASTPPPTTPTAPTAPTVPATGSATAAAGSAAPAQGSAAPAVAKKEVTKLIVVVKTEAAAKDAKLIIDGQPAEGLTTEIPVDKKTVKVEVKSSGFRSYEKKLDLTPGELTLEIEMAKRPTGPATQPVRPPKRPDKPPSGGGGLIDI
jgi:hypothetical protein